MTESLPLTFYHVPRTRSTGVLLLLEALAAPYTLHLINMKAGEQRQAAYLAVNPMGKVPAIRHGDAVVTEQAAIYLYLADLFPDAGLAPPIGDKLRGPYLRWMIFYAASFEPAVIDRAMQRTPTSAGMSPYGDYDIMLNTLIGQLSQGPYILGTEFSAVDILWATALAWTVEFKLVPDAPVVMAYIARVLARPDLIRGQKKDDELAASQAS